MENVYYTKDPISRDKEVIERSALLFLDLNIMTPEELQKELAEAEERAENF